ncbi:hypothetical protein AvCA_06690 [Azotobacter vinelandii CA]|uniref:Lipoprotein n=2 Tax=Azotobacter vinelandii TaxID=354 RepID=C1DLH2_AZOVD|nr:hypothetical protein [Azotobacter vinelandii]ACO76920.1 conserved hypothetical protein [Azotobacter vinelandii DJ]AGK17225.1 hypothetical protein AvCA_06690 [Azotobacter vinelandii CA]AGK19442.1 hypothetical protein AvCA6_06690 [Azotobacter vinelandii CA6]WKN22668.1 hypothetical protein AVAEIV_000665 [Azotobacter vinelandii]SFX41040.1 Uncharacterized lipoprotein YbaY [Azotobacter vinelandii]
MSPRPFLLLGLSLLLAACSSQPEEEASQASANPSTPSVAVQPLLAGQHELRGNLLGAPTNSEVELALLLVDERGRPRGELGNITLLGNGQTLPFSLRFVPQPFAPGLRAELRGRASQSGRLILRLPPRTLSGLDSQTLGTLQLVPAP